MSYWAHLPFFLGESRDRLNATIQKWRGIHIKIFHIDASNDIRDYYFYRPTIEGQQYMQKIKLDIVALSHSVTQSHNYAVVLGEESGPRRLPIVIGGFEAQAIAVAIENMSPNRPLTHDLFRNAMQAFEIELKEVVINNLIDGIFYAQLICEKNGELIEVDSRTSDAIAMAVRFECPIYTYEFIMESAGVILEDEQIERSGAQVVEPSPAKKKKSIEDLDMSELEKMLDKAIAEEDYEKAARIRDELNSRSDN